jgi:predicted nucleotidyltransferase component of viral defense system
VVEIEISFRDQVYHFQELRLEDAQVSVKAFSLSEIIAEKLRALFQQITRDRYRRQDVYDIAFLIENIEINEHEKTEILDVLKLKCESRGIEIGIDSIDNPELKSRARDDWKTIRLEIPDLPEFDAQFELVRSLYYSLPWK